MILHPPLILMTKLTLEKHEFDVLKEIIDERLTQLKCTIKRHYANLDKYERDISNYTTYDLWVKLGGVK